MAWFNGKVSLGNFPDLGGAVNKFSESVKNIEKNFNTALEEKAATDDDSNNTNAGNTICSWGRGEDGQLGHGDAEDRLSLTQLSALIGQEIISVTCGADHTTALSASHIVYSWGWYDLRL